MKIYLSKNENKYKLALIFVFFSLFIWTFLHEDTYMNFFINMILTWDYSLIMLLPIIIIIWISYDSINKKLFYVSVNLAFSIISLLYMSFLYLTHKYENFWYMFFIIFITITLMWIFSFLEKLKTNKSDPVKENVLKNTQDEIIENQNPIELENLVNNDTDLLSDWIIDNPIIETIEDNDTIIEISNEDNIETELTKDSELIEFSNSNDIANDIEVVEIKEDTIKSPSKILIKEKLNEFKIKLQSLSSKDLFALKEKITWLLLNSEKLNEDQKKLLLLEKEHVIAILAVNEL